MTLPFREIPFSHHKAAVYPWESWSKILVVGCPSSHQPARIREEMLESGRPLQRKLNFRLHALSKFDWTISELCLEMADKMKCLKLLERRVVLDINSSWVTGRGSRHYIEKYTRSSTLHKRNDDSRIWNICSVSNHSNEMKKNKSFVVFGCSFLSAIRWLLWTSIWCQLSWATRKKT